MCGIVGYWDKKGADLSIAIEMSKRIQHRGPDDAGVWMDNKKCLVLAHRRLSILDLSQAGHQPMDSPCGRFVLVYNGEIYNHHELRTELEKVGGHFNWRGHSDTETLLAALRHWGIEETLSRLNGMFAFSLWDKVERKLYLARDRMGEKPLYYGKIGQAFFFGSELKAFKAHPSWFGNIDRNALTLYLRHNYIPTPHSIYRGIYKLAPAHYIIVGNEGDDISRPKCYWDLGKVSESCTVNDGRKPMEYIDELDEFLRDSVKKRMASDVPLGVFLSGGIDSSLIAALMQVQSNRPVKTFTIGFNEEGFNEAVYGKAVANHLGTEHTELYVTSEEAMAVIPLLSTIWDEPFSDSSQIPTYLVSKLARQQVSVSLSGDGGDELFFGYHRYIRGYNIWRFLRLFPKAYRQVLGNKLNSLSNVNLESILRILPKRFQYSYLSDRLQKLAELVKVSSGESFYHHLISHWKDPGKILLNGIEPLTIFNTPNSLPTFPSLCEKMMYLDSLSYLPDDILTKIDRASMAVSLETRVPLLDHRVVEFSWKIPMSLKYRNGIGKWPLREILYRYVPHELMERPKMGFGVPIEHWLRGPLRDWAENLLDEKRLREEGYFDPAPIRLMWDEHVSGKRRWHYYLWDVLMFQSWKDEN